MWRKWWGKRGKKEIKKKSKGTCVEEVVGKKRKEGKKEKKVRVHVWRRTKEGEKKKKRIEGNIREKK